MAKTSRTPRDDGTVRSADVADSTVAQIGKAVSEILRLREPLEERMATARTEQERQNIADQIEDAAVRAISDQGLTVAECNEVIAAAESDPDLEERVLIACRSA
jgi:hypothetical protein